MKFLFFSPHTLADSCSGAAKSVHTLLEELIGLGHQCLVVTGTVTDGRSQLFERVLQAPSAQSFQIDHSDVSIPLRKVKVQSVDHMILGTRAMNAKDMRSYEEMVLREVYLNAFAAFAPDVVLTYGGFPSCFFAGQYAMTKGRKSVLYAASDSYRKETDVVHVNQIATTSTALRTRLEKFTTLPIVTLASLVRRSDFLCAERSPDYLTFVNPVPAKGLLLAAALAAECRRRNRPYKFLFVESRGTRKTALDICPALADCANVNFVQNASDVRAIYGRTKILLYPSVWFEAAGRAPIEANANGIPVLAHNVGGIGEMLNGAGYLFDPPPESLTNWQAPVPPEHVERWLNVIDRLHDEPAQMEDAVRRAREADSRYDVRALAEKFVAAVG